MLKKKKQKKRVLKYWRAMEQHLQAFYHTGDPEELHRLRIRLKKINALLLFPDAKPGKYKFVKTLHPVHTIFKHAGKVRNASINLALIRKYRPTDQAFEAEQQELLASQTGKFLAKKQAYQKLLKKERKELPKNFRDLKNRFVLDRYKKSIRQISQTFARPRQKAAKLHGARKQIKMLLYVYKLLPKPLRSDLKLNTRYLHRLEDVLGQWHDVDSVIKFLISKNDADNRSLDEIKKARSKFRRAVKKSADKFPEKVYKKPG